QDPPEMIPQFVKEWEQGYKIVCGIKESSSENKLMWWMRSLYYKLIQMNSSIKQIEHFTGFALYDRDFIEIMRSLQDTTPTLRGLVAEYGYKVKKISFHQPKRKKGKSSQNFLSLFDYAMRNFTTYTKTGLHLATLGGALIAGVSVVIGCVYLVLKLIFWDNFSAGMAPLLIGMFFLGAVQIFFIGLVGEYVMSVNARVMKKPYAIEEERLNFDEAVKPEHVEYYHPSERKEKE
ncbi:MAG: glycosyltransferase, partial [Oscillospiraceae bacterium]|nr:glycosyltransferase [Oscillospiraceae bacterium]